MKARRIRLGRRGESLALRHLKQKGYEIIEKNYRCPLGEIDLIARVSSRIVFIEIKTLKSDRFGPPRISVHKGKQIRLARLAQYYMKQKGIEDSSARFDVVEVCGADGGWKVGVIEDAFELPQRLL